MRIVLKFCLALVVFALGMSSAWGQQVLTWTFTGSPAGSGTVVDNFGTSPSGTALTDFVRNGVTLADANNVFNSSNWSLGGVDASKNIAFTMTANSGRVLHLTQLLFSQQRSTTGPSSVDVQLVVGGNLLESLTVAPPTIAATSTFDIINTITQDTARFNWLGYGATNTAGTYRVDNVALTYAPGPALPATSSNITLAANTRLYAATNNFSLTGVVSGAFNVSKEGTGTISLDAANTYTGNTTLSAGTLVIGSSGSINNSPTITVASGAIFDVNTVSGGFSLLSAQTLQGTGSVIGSTTLASGTTIRGDSGAGTGTLTTGNVTVLSGGNIAANLGASGTSSQLSVGASTLDLKTGSVLKLDDVSGFSVASGATWIIAQLTSGNLSLDGTNQLNGFQFGRYTQGSGNIGPVNIDVTALPAFATGDQLTLSRTGNNLVLVFVPVPEPALLFGIAAGIMGLGAVVRKKFFAPATAA